MTTNATGIDNRVRQLDNEVQSIYEMLARVQGTQTRHTNRLSELAIRLDEVNEVLGMRVSVADQHSTERDAAIEARLERVESRLDEVLDLLRGQRG